MTIVLYIELALKTTENLVMAKRWSWFAHSSDLNPIENMWAYVKRHLGAPQPQFQDLEQTVTEIWNKISQNFIQNLYKSMPKRVEACLKNKG